MKKLLLITIAFSLSLTQVMHGENGDKKKHKRHAVADSQQVVGARQPVNGPRQAAPIQAAPRQVRSGIAPRTAVRSEAVMEGRAVQPGTRAVTRAHPTRAFNRNSFTVAKRNVVVVRHPRGWWVNRFPRTRFVLFGGGYYYWWGGYWYPAPGYDPYYSTYMYNEPIYAPDSVAPGQMIENVQMSLRDQGYYYGAADGMVGPQTREALARFQRDHGLLVTSAIDEPTLVTLGLA